MKKRYQPENAHLTYALAAAHHNMHTNLNKRLKELNIQVESWRLLEALDKNSDFTMGELAGIVLMPAPTFTRLVDRMVAKGLVHRHICPEDQRRIQLLPTEQGYEIIQKVKIYAENQDNEILNKLGAEKAEELFNL